MCCCSTPQALAGLLHTSRPPPLPCCAYTHLFLLCIHTHAPAVHTHTCPCCAYTHAPAVHTHTCPCCQHTCAGSCGRRQQKHRRSHLCGLQAGCTVSLYRCLARHGTAVQSPRLVLPDCFRTVPLSLHYKNMLETCWGGARLIDGGQHTQRAVAAICVSPWTVTTRQTACSVLPSCQHAPHMACPGMTA
jgi:hypothetical protein